MRFYYWIRNNCADTKFFKRHKSFISLTDILDIDPHAYLLGLNDKHFSLRLSPLLSFMEPLAEPPPYPFQAYFAASVSFSSSNKYSNDDINVNSMLLKLLSKMCTSQEVAWNLLWITTICTFLLREFKVVRLVCMLVIAYTMKELIKHRRLIQPKIIFFMELTAWGHELILCTFVVILKLQCFHVFVLLCLQ